MKLDPILEQSEPSCSEFESTQSKLVTNNKPCEQTDTTLNESFTQEILDESVNPFLSEVKRTTKRIVKFVIKNILLIILKIVECSWLIVLNVISIPLKWNLHLCQVLLDFLIKGICCLSCLACNWSKRHQSQEEQPARRERESPRKQALCGSRKQRRRANRKLAVVLDID